jgi:hypothetical protein
VQLTPVQQGELERRLATLDQDRAQSLTCLFFSLRPRARNSSTRKTGMRPRLPV